MRNLVNILMIKLQVMHLRLKDEISGFHLLNTKIHNLFQSISLRNKFLYFLVIIIRI